MFQVRFHGRGGQGVVTAAELLATAAFVQDRYAQAFPSFGSERMGAPVIVQDPTLLHQADLLAGLSGQGYLLINAGRTPEGEFIRRFRRDRLLVVPASQLARTFLGRPRQWRCAVPG
jgi:pyruvate ferredoxin oxidoreductase gamma subunit